MQITHYFRQISLYLTLLFSEEFISDFGSVYKHAVSARFPFLSQTDLGSDNAVDLCSEISEK
jgi:hypothetical protein